MEAQVINIQDVRKKREQALIKAGARLQRMIDEARKHPLGLYKLCFSDDEGRPIVLKWFHKEWAELVLNHTHVMIEAPRGCSKTTSIAVAFTLWYLGKNPELRIKIICGNDGHAQQRLAEIRSHINNDKLYQLVFPHVKEDPDKKNDSSCLNLITQRHSKDYTLEAKGVMSDGTGGRSDLIIFDDVCTQKNTIDEPSMKPKVLTKVSADWLNTLNPRTGRVWCIFTPWATDDANAILKKRNQNKWAYRRYAHGKPGNPYHSIFPELFPESKLRDLRLDIGAFEYTKAYLCRISSEMTQIVQSKWLKTYTQYDLTPQILNRSDVTLSIDPTGGKRSQVATTKRSKDPDYIGVSVLLTDTYPQTNPSRPKAPNRIYIVEAYQLRLSTANAVQHILELNHIWKPNQILVEAQGALSLHEWLQTQASHLPIIPIPAPLSKQQRLESITPWLQDPDERILFHPRTIQSKPKPFSITVGGKTPETAEALRPLRDQLLNFPTKHDDVMDSVIQGLRFISQYVVSSTKNEDDETNESNIEIKSISV